MTAEWETARLGDLVGHKKGFAFKSSDYRSFGHAIIRVSNFTDRSIDLSECNYLDPKEVSQYDPYKLRHRDVVIATVGSWPTNPASVVGKTICVPEEADGALLNQNAVALRAKDNFDQRFLFYLLKQPNFQSYILGAAQGSASQASIKLTDIFGFQFLRPPLAEQSKIASILGALDDKIELNRRMNETLEAMARAIFKDWFVDFGPTRAKQEARSAAGTTGAAETRGRAPYLAPEIWSLFPDRLDETNKPVGWETRTLAQLTDKIGSGATPSGGQAVYVTEGVSLIRSQNVYDHEFVWGGLARITDRDAERLKGVTVYEGDVLINITGDSILRTCVVDASVLPARVNQHVSIVRPSIGIPSHYLHQFLVMPRTKDILLGNDAGGSRAAVTKGHLEVLPIPFPGQELLDVFDHQTSPLFHRINANLVEARTLAALRDLLLPKLMSGEIRVKDAEKAVGEAA